MTAVALVVQIRLDGRLFYVEPWRARPALGEVVRFGLDDLIGVVCSARCGARLLGRVVAYAEEDE